MNNLTQDRLAEIRARCEAATQGKVFPCMPEDVQEKDAFLKAVETVWDETVKASGARPYYAVGYQEDGKGTIVALCGNGPLGKANSEFLAKSYEDIPDLVAEVERTQAFDALVAACEGLVADAELLGTIGVAMVSVQKAKAALKLAKGE